MKKRTKAILIILALVIACSTGVIFGCESESFPKQLSLPKSERKKVTKENPFRPDSSIVIQAGPQYDVNGFKIFLFGTLNRKLWIEPVRMPLFDVRTVNGGMKGVKSGGNMQTLSLRMKAKNGRRYVLRTVDKDQSVTIKKPWRSKVTSYIMRNEVVTMHPYSALVLPKLAEVAGIFHTNPKLYFIPYDPNLGRFAKEVEGRVMILEEYPDKTWSNSSEFGYADSILSSTEMLAKRYTNHKVVIDQIAYARARIFDLWINDWDRHTNQWRFAEFDTAGKIIFKPIPRDRDIAFFKFNSGLVPFIAIRFNPKFQTFDEDYNVEKMTLNSKYIDLVILNDLKEEDFVSIAKEYQKIFTDSIINDALKVWPPEVYKIAHEETLEVLKARRAKLTQAAKDYYKTTFKEVKIIGTDNIEKFIVNRNNNTTSVEMYNEKDSLLFHHNYDNEVTEIINLFGLKGKDQFLVKGKVEDGITINIYGGEDSDVIKDESSVDGWSKKTIVIDSKEDNTIVAGEETDDQTTDDQEILRFDRIGIKKKE